MISTLLKFALDTLHININEALYSIPMSSIMLMLYQDCLENDFEDEYLEIGQDDIDSDNYMKIITERRKTGIID